MSLHRKIAQNTIGQLIGKIISTLLGLVAIGILTRYLGTEKFGWYTTVSTTLQFIGIIIDFGFTLTTTNFLAEEKYNENKLLNTLFTWRFLTALIFHGIALFIFILLPYNAPIKTAAIITTFSFFCLALNQIFVGYYQAKLKNYIQMIGEVLGRIVLVAGIALVAYFNRGFLSAMFMISISSLIFTFYLWLKGPKIRFEFDKTISKELFKRSWPLALGIIFNAVYLQGDRVLLPFYVDQTEIGLYGAAYKVLDFVIQSAALLMGILLPLLTNSWIKKNITEFKKHVELTFELLSVFLLPALTISLSLSTSIMKLIGGKDFMGSGAILSLLSITMLGICLGMAGGHILLATGHQKTSLFIFVSNAIISLVGYFIFIPRFGIWGAASVTIFSEWYAGILLCVFAAFYTKITPRFYMLFKILIASSVMGAVVYILQPFSMILSLLLAFILYAGLIIIFKIISFDTIKQILFSRSKSKEIIAKNF